MTPVIARRFVRAYRRHVFEILVRPKHPERVCWGCDKLCPVNDLACGNGTIAALHPAELFGDDWLEWANARGAQSAATTRAAADEVSAAGTAPRR